MKIKINKLSAAISLLLGMTLTSIAQASDIVQLERNGYSFRFEERIDKTKGDLYGQTVGHISIVRLADNSLVYSEDTALRPGCDELPAIKLINDRYLSLCGHLGGRHYTQQIISLDMLHKAKLDMHDMPRQVEVDANGQLVVLVSLRDLFSDLQGPIYFPMIYKSYRDQVTFGFQRNFDADVSIHYLRYYDQLKLNEATVHQIPAMLAALMASQNKKFVCAEIPRIESILQKKLADKKPSATVKIWLARLQAYGYPAIDTEKCDAR
jgi:hypothetical protein